MVLNKRLLQLAILAIALIYSSCTKESESSNPFASGDTEIPLDGSSGEQEKEEDSNEDEEGDNNGDGEGGSEDSESPEGSENGDKDDAEDPGNSDNDEDTTETPDPITPEEPVVPEEPVEPEPTEPTPVEPEVPAGVSADQAKILELVNEVRAEGCDCGGQYYPPVAPVTWNAKLAASSYKHSKDMSDHNYFSHTSLDGRSAGDRITAEGYQWRTYGENIAMGYRTPETVMAGWIASPGHCKNLMNGNFKELGVGIYNYYWTQNFGTSR
ncbi:CAP domain-containing protein [Sediminitomix flava]|uniref:Uncharacterized protein YkwD n=1 Tax=Sediminitomix flava TaxID=379075 RepID=A0A315Z7S1_SEDFL|nr:CAP domain-containing protein [Sediminitomix flava]PWJ39250.1 uncharacterized protein YkwD [Sediminitomix flava]